MKRIIQIILPALLLLANSVTAQYHLYIKAIDGNGNLIEGESAVQGHEKEIEAFSYGHDITNCCGDRVGKTTIGKVIVNIQLGKASNLLKAMLIKGTYLKSVLITAVKSGDKPVDFYKISMEDVFLSQMTEGIPELSQNPQQQVSFNADRIGWTYFPQRSDGLPGDPVKFGWDIKKQVEWSDF